MGAGSRRRAGAALHPGAARPGDTVCLRRLAGLRGPRPDHCRSRARPAGGPRRRPRSAGRRLRSDRPAGRRQRHVAAAPRARRTASERCPDRRRRRRVRRARHGGRAGRRRARDLLRPLPPTARAGGAGAGRRARLDGRRRPHLGAHHGLDAAADPPVHVADRPLHRSPHAGPLARPGAPFQPLPGRHARPAHPARLQSRRGPGRTHRGGQRGVPAHDHADPPCRLSVGRGTRPGRHAGHRPGRGDARSAPRVGHGHAARRADRAAAHPRALRAHPRPGHPVSRQRRRTGRRRAHPRPDRPAAAPGGRRRAAAARLDERRARERQPGQPRARRSLARRHRSEDPPWRGRRPGGPLGVRQDDRRRVAARPAPSRRRPRDPRRPRPRRPRPRRLAPPGVVGAAEPDPVSRQRGPEHHARHRWSEHGAARARRAACRRRCVRARPAARLRHGDRRGRPPALGRRDPPRGARPGARARRAPAHSGRTDGRPRHRERLADRVLRLADGKLTEELGSPA